MIYLASPYSHPEPCIREARYEAACRATAAFVRAGHPVYCPIVHSHPLARFGLPTDWAFWEVFDRAHLRNCEQLVVLMLRGWRESECLRAEVQIAIELELPVSYLGPEGC